MHFDIFIPSLYSLYIASKPRDKERPHVIQKLDTGMAIKNLENLFFIQKIIEEAIALPLVYVFFCTGEHCLVINSITIHQKIFPIFI